LPETIAERVRKVMALTFNVAPESIADTAQQSDVAGWDSIGHANLMFGLEEEFEVQLSDDVMPTLRSFAMIVEHFQQQLS